MELIVFIVIALIFGFVPALWALGAYLAMAAVLGVIAD